MPRQPGGDDVSHNPVHPGPDERAIVQERAVPVRPPDLMRMLLAEPGLNEADRASLTEFARLLEGWLNHEFHLRQRELKDLYDPIDPDADYVDVCDPASPEPDRSELEARFVAGLEDLLIRANYRPLTLKDIHDAVAAPNEIGLNYEPNFDLFERLHVWVRGETTVRRAVRRWRLRFRKITVIHDAYQRIVVTLKFKPGVRLDDQVRSDVLYLRMFKDVPRVDMEMHLPEQGTKVRMRAIDKAKIASPVAVSLPTLIFKVIKSSVVLKLLGGGLFAAVSLPTSVLATLVVAPVSAGVNSFFGFQRAKQSHLHFMIRQLYYMTLANNASVILRLIDAAEEEEFKEAILAYFVLWRGAGSPRPWDRERLDRAVEDLLEKRAGVRTNFEIADALHKLRRLTVLRGDDRGPMSVLPLGEAIERVRQRWDDAI